MTVPSLASSHTIMPVCAHPQIIARFASGRVRAMILPYERYNRLHRDALLSVCEPVTVEDRHPKRAEVTVRYDRVKKPVVIPWPRRLILPVPGRRSARAMPILFSRYTLQVRSVEPTRLRAITDEVAEACGAVPTFGGGYCSALGDPEIFKPFNFGWEALGHVWDDEHGFRSSDGNPEVVLVYFKAIARNIAKIVSGMGDGTQPWK